MRWRIVAVGLLLVAGCGETQPSPLPGEQPGANATTRPASGSTTQAPMATTLPPSSTAVVPSTTTTTIAPPTTTLPAVAVHVFPLDPADVGDYSPGGHSYPATDIFAPIGTRFVAVTSGVVQGTSRSDAWDLDVNDGATRGGLFVSLIGDDGVRYYGSHLSAVADGIEAGVRVEAGQLLGLVGISGSARDTPPHLHFGISRPTALEDWEIRRGEIDPVPFLNAWRAGDTTATPEI